MGLSARGEASRGTTSARRRRGRPGLAERSWRDSVQNCRCQSGPCVFELGAGAGAALDDARARGVGRGPTLGVRRHVRAHPVFRGCSRRYDERDPPATSEPRARRQSAIGGTPPPVSESERDRHGILAPSLGAVGFASTENLAEIMPYLNRSLAELGYPSPLELLLPNAGDLARTCNAIFLMLRDRQDDVTARDEWAAERRRLQSDLARAETHVHRLKSERDAKDHELLSLRAKHERALAAARANLEKAVGERDARKRELHLASQRRAQLENDARKRELEHDRLKRRLSSLVSDKSRDVVCGSIQIRRRRDGAHG